MPQFDKITFLSQILWLFLIFSIFYFGLMKFYLVGFGFIFKSRVKKLKYDLLVRKFLIYINELKDDKGLSEFLNKQGLFINNLFNPFYFIIFNKINKNRNYINLFV